MARHHLVRAEQIGARTQHKEYDHPNNDEFGNLRRHGRIVARCVTAVSGRHYHEAEMTPVLVSTVLPTGA